MYDLVTSKKLYLMREIFSLTSPLHCVKSVRICRFFCLYSVKMRENTDQKNSEYGHFSRSVGSKNNQKSNHQCAGASVMMSQILKFVNSTKTKSQKIRHL